MKMEHTLRSLAAGTVVRVHTKAGDRVKDGDELIVLEKAAPAAPPTAA